MTIEVDQDILVDIRVLGPVRATVGEVPVPLRGARQIRLLAALALNVGRVVTTDRLVDVGWHPEAPATARRQIQDLVSRLRKDLVAAGCPAVAVSTHAAGYRLNLPPAAVDAVRFRDMVAAARLLSDTRPREAVDVLRSALGLWRGDALTDVAGPALDSERVELDELRLVAWEQRIETELGLGRHGDVVGELTALARRHPTRENLVRLGMLGLHRTGRTADALTLFRTTREHLAQELGIDPGTELVRLHERILRADPTLVRMRPALHVRPADPEPGEPADVVVPRQVPAAPADFVGRDDIIKDVMRRLDQARPGAVDVVCVVGMPGIGKTSLAHHLAHLVRDRFPGGSLYATLADGSGHRVDPGTALAMFLRALGLVDDGIPPSMPERAALFRSVLASRERTLVVLDNAVDEEQIRPLVPGSDAAVLITSRRPMAGIAGVQLFRVDALASADGEALLARAIGDARVAAEPAAARGVVDLCGGVPLALHIAAMRLMQGDNVSLRQLAGRLSDERHRLDELSAGDLDVRTSIHIAERQLSADARRLLRRLGDLPFASYPEWLCAACGDSGSVWAAEELRRSHLLESADHDSAADDDSPAEPGRRYRMHDLVRLYAADAARDAPGDDHPQPLIRAALAMIRAATATAAANFLLLRSRGEDGERIHTSILVAMDRDDIALDGRDEAAVRLGRATFLRMQDRHHEALAELRRAYRLALAHDDADLATAAALGWSVSAQMAGRPRIARAAAGVTAILVGQGAGGHAAGYAIMVAAHVGLVPDSVALPLAVAALRRTGDQWGEAEATSLLAGSASLADRPDDVLVHLERSRELYRTVGDTIGATMAEILMAEHHTSHHRPDRAAPLLRQALRTARLSRHRYMEARTLKNIGQLYAAAHRTESARTHLLHAVAIFRELDMPGSLAATLTRLADVHDRLGEDRAAAAVSQEARTLRARQDSAAHLP